MIVHRASWEKTAKLVNMVLGHLPLAGHPPTDNHPSQLPPGQLSPRIVVRGVVVLEDGCRIIGGSCLVVVVLGIVVLGGSCPRGSCLGVSCPGIVVPGVVVLEGG